MGRRDVREPGEWLFDMPEKVGLAQPVDSGLLGPTLTCTRERGPVEELDCALQDRLIL